MYTSITYSTYFPTDKLAYGNAEELRTEFRTLDPDICDFLLGMLREDPDNRKSAQFLLSHTFIRKGQEHMERQNRPMAHRFQGIGEGNNSTDSAAVEALRRQVEQLQRDRMVT